MYTLTSDITSKLTEDNGPILENSRQPQLISSVFDLDLIQLMLKHE